MKRLQQESTRFDAEVFGGILAHLGFAVLERVNGQEAFHLVGARPAWWNCCFNSCESDTVTADQCSPFLKDYLIGPHPVWESDDGTIEKSGPWTEADGRGGTITLEATALSVGARQILLVERLGTHFQQMQEIVQRARDRMLAEDAAVKSHRKTESRLTNQLKSSERIKDDALALLQHLDLAALANGGVIPLAGFWSKDEILHAMTSHGNAVVFLIALVWVLLSGIYTARMVYYTFFGAPRNQSLYDHAHESPFPMVLPLVLLGILSVVAGFVVIPDVAKAIGMPEGFAELVRGTRVNPAIVLGEEAETFHFNATLATAGTVSVLLGMYFAWWLVSSPRRVGRFVSSAPDLYNLAKNKFYFDEMYQWLIDRVLLVAAYGVAWFDRNIINDTGVDGTSSLMSYFGYRLKLFQTGRIPNYALAIIAGIITLVVVAFSTIA